MKEIQLSRGLFALVDDEDYSVLINWKWYADSARNTFYAKRSIHNPTGKGTTQKMHRLILGITDPKIQVDHIDGNGLNNQRSNLRICQQGENSRNRKGNKSATSKYKGVFLHSKNKNWNAQIRCGSKKIHIGAFNTEDEAALAYNEAAIKHHGAFAKLNIV